MDNKYYEDIDSVFSTFKQILDNYCKSEVLKNFFSDLFESFIYANLINNFFLNLNEENIIEYHLPAEEIDNIKTEFKSLQNNVETALSMSSEKQIVEEDYSNFKDIIQTKFPDFLKLISEMEKLIDISNLKEYLENKKKEMNNSGKTDCDINDYLVTKTLEEFVKNNNIFPDLDDPELLNLLSDEEFLEKIPKKTLDKFSKMKLTDWDIWHSYSSYFTKEINNPEEIAKKLVENDICPLVFASNTEFWYKIDNQVKKSKLEIKHLDQSKFGFEVTAKIDGYPKEVLWQAAQMWYREWCLFSENYRESYPYLRCFLNACYLKKGPRTIALYPQFKIYSNGVYNLLFREISPSNFTYYLEPFIENEVNLPNLLLDSIEIPPEIIKGKNVFKYELVISNLPIHKKIKGTILKNRFIRNTEIFIDENTKEIKGEDFSFRVFSLNPKSTDLYLDNLCRIIISSFTHILNQTSNSLTKVNMYYPGDFWTLRPAIYILDFINQPSTSSEIIEEFGDQLGKIMARVSDIRYGDFRSFLGKNLRDETFGDFTLHINEALSLWTISKKGLLSTKLDPNRGNIIYEKQVQIEAIDHLYLSHRRLFERASIFSIPYTTVISEQLELLNLEELVTDTDKISNFGEIDEIISFLNQELGWNSIRNAIEKKLELRSQYSIQNRNRFFKKFSIILTIIFGLGGITIFSEKVLYPIFSYYTIPLYVNPAIQVPFLTIILILATILITAILLRNKF